MKRSLLTILMLFLLNVYSLAAEDKLTILMVSHDLTMIRRAADWVTGINRNVTFDGSARTFCNLKKIGKLFGEAALAVLQRPDGETP
jgi:ABC-type Mn2+/Zn2+ transport system ATPase subunit